MQMGMPVWLERVYYTVPEAREPDDETLMTSMTTCFSLVPTFNLFPPGPKNLQDFSMSHSGSPDDERSPF